MSREGLRPAACIISPLVCTERIAKIRSSEVLTGPEFTTNFAPGLKIFILICNSKRSEKLNILYQDVSTCWQAPPNTITPSLSFKENSRRVMSLFTPFFVLPFSLPSFFFRQPSTSPTNPFYQPFPSSPVKWIWMRFSFLLLVRNFQGVLL
jgi:hypothetical protein